MRDAAIYAQGAAMRLRTPVLDGLDGEARLALAINPSTNPGKWVWLSTGEREFLEALVAILRLRGRLSSVDAWLMRDLFDVADVAFRPRKTPEARRDGAGS